MKKLIAAVLFVLLAVPCYAFMDTNTVNSGTWTPSALNTALHHYKNSDRYTLTLTATSNGSGAASITINDLGMLDIMGYSCIVVEPDSTDTPDADFDLSITDDAGREIITGGQGTDLSNSAATSIYLDLTHVLDSMTIAFSNMGAAKKATITIVFDLYYP